MKISTKVATGAVIASLMTATLAFAATASDLVVTSSSLGGGTVSGLIGKGTYSKGARVDFVRSATYHQDCTDPEADDAPVTVYETQTSATTTGASYSSRTNRRGKLTGYTWNYNGALGSTPGASSGDICDGNGYDADGTVDLDSEEGHVFLSNDGVTEMLDSVTGFPIEVTLNP